MKTALVCGAGGFIGGDEESCLRPPRFYRHGGPKPVAFIRYNRFLEPKRPVFDSCNRRRCVQIPLQGTPTP